MTQIFMNFCRGAPVCAPSYESYEKNTGRTRRCAPTILLKEHFNGMVAGTDDINTVFVPCFQVGSLRDDIVIDDITYWVNDAAAAGRSGHIVFYIDAKVLKHYGVKNKRKNHPPDSDKE